MDAEEGAAAILTLAGEHMVGAIREITLPAAGAATQAGSRWKRLGAAKAASSFFSVSPRLATSRSALLARCFKGFNSRLRSLLRGVGFALRSGSRAVGVLSPARRKRR